MSTTGPFNPFLAAFIAIVLTAIATISVVTLPLSYSADPNDKVGLISRIIVIGITMWACYRLIRSTRGLGKAIPLLALICIVALLANTIVWARG